MDIYGENEHIAPGNRVFVEGVLYFLTSQAARNLTLRDYKINKEQI